MVRTGDCSLLEGRCYRNDNSMVVTVPLEEVPSVHVLLLLSEKVASSPLQDEADSLTSVTDPLAAGSRQPRVAFCFPFSLLFTCSSSQSSFHETGHKPSWGSGMTTAGRWLREGGQRPKAEPCLWFPAQRLCLCLILLIFISRAHGLRVGAKEGLSVWEAPTWLPIMQAQSVPAS